MKSRFPRLWAHLRVVGIATFFGLAAYAVIRALIAVSNRLGLLDWLRN